MADDKRGNDVGWFYGIDLNAKKPDYNSITLIDTKDDSIVNRIIPTDNPKRDYFYKAFVDNQKEKETMEKNSTEYYGAYHLGALMAAKKIIEQYICKSWTGENKVYRDAELRLIMRDKRSIQLFLDGCYDIMYRNHKRDKKGKLISCEAYFADRYKNFEEVK